jgi:hypothetical protein
VDTYVTGKRVQDCSKGIGRISWSAAVSGQARSVCRGEGSGTALAVAMCW